MPCYYPMTGYWSRTVNPSGRRSVVFNPNDAYSDLRISVPCGQCIGCRLERSRQWAVRCMHEAAMHDDNCFVTLTYDNDHIPFGGTLVKSDYQNFLKRLRKRIGKVRYFLCGEYGENFSRPHYHLCLFGYSFPDRELFSTRGGTNYYVSPVLSDLWSFGYHLIGNLTFESAAYTSRYLLKKVLGPGSEDYYDGRLPEFVSMSRRPGIGSEFYEAFGSDMYPRDEVVVNGKKMRPPKFYDSRFEIDNPVEMEILRKKRFANRKTHDIKRMHQAADAKAYRVKKGLRSYEEGI